MEDKYPVLVTRRLPAEALDRVMARCDVALYDGEGAMARDRLLAEVAGKATVNTRLAMANLAIDNLLAGLDGSRPPSLLNPQAWAGGGAA